VSHTREYNSEAPRLSPGEADHLVASHKGMGPVRVQALLIDPVSPATLYAGTYTAGVFKTSARAWEPGHTLRRHRGWQRLSPGSSSAAQARACCTVTSPAPVASGEARIKRPAARRA
jgi:hypothetical protein